MNKVQEALNEAFEALLPFADCLQYIEIDEDDEEWAKFRLLIKHYRQAAVAYEKCKSALSEIEKCEPVANRNEAVSHLWESIGLWSAYLASNGEQAELSPPSWLVDAINNATSPQQREWKDIDLSVYENQGLGVIAEEICAKLKQLNEPEKG